MSKVRKRRKPKPVDRQGGLRLTEEAVHLLRGASVKAWAWYFAGSVPFWLAVVWYVTLMSESGLAARQVVSGALAPALLYGWMKCCQSMFAIELWRGAGKPVELTPGWRRRLVFRQCFWQPWGLLLVPLSHPLMVPYPYACAFFQNLTVCEALGETEDRSVRARAAGYASKEVLKSLSFLLAGKPALFLLAGLNWLTVLALAPQLAYSLTGIENDFVRHPWVAYTGSGFWMTAAMFAFLTVDPLLKAFYLLKCSATASRKTGEDLRDELRGLRKAAAAGLAMALLLGAPGIGPSTAHAENQPRMDTDGHGWGLGDVVVDPAEVVGEIGRSDGVPPSHPVLDVSELDGAIDRVSRQEKFLWRMPPEMFEGDGEDLNPLQVFLKSMAESLGDAVEDLFDTLGDWWDRLFGDWEPELKDEPTNVLSGLEALAKGLMILLIAALVILVAVLGWKAWRRRQPRVKAEEGAGPAPEPDLNDENVMANELPVDGWLDLARDLQAKGEFRLALRALFLAFLARLDERRLLVIRRSKSNRDYERELASRGLPDPELLPFFQRFRRDFEAVWYGDYPTGTERVDEVRDWLERWGEAT